MLNNEAKDSDPLHLKIALKYLDTREFPGAKNNPVVQGFFRRVVGRFLPDSVAWCAAFVGSCLVEAGKPSSGKLNARSYLKYGEPVSLGNARPGDIVVVKRGLPWQGHVFFFIYRNEKSIIGVGGNQSNKVSIAPRDKSSVLGIRRVK